MSSQYDFGNADVFWSGVAAGVLAVSPEARARVETLLGGKFPQSGAKPTPVAPQGAVLQGLEADLARVLVKYGNKFNEAERKELADEFRQMVDGAARRKGETPDFEVTQMWLRDFTKEHGFDERLVFRFWLALDKDELRKLADDNAVNLKTVGHYLLSQLRALSELPDLTKIDGFGARSQNYKLLEVLASHGLKAPRAAPKRGRKVVTVKDEVTLGYIGSVADVVAEKLEIMDPSKATRRLFGLLGSEEVQTLATANGIDLSMGPDEGYTLEAVRALSELAGLTKLRHFSKESQSYRLLRELVRLSGE